MYAICWYFTEFLPDSVSLEKIANVGFLCPDFSLTYWIDLKPLSPITDGSAGTRQPLYPKPYSFVVGVCEQYVLSNAQPK